MAWRRGYPAFTLYYSRVYRQMVELRPPRNVYDAVTHTRNIFFELLFLLSYGRGQVEAVYVLFFIFL
jgi:hypothetical protein